MGSARPARGELGATIVEAAIIFPVLISLILGIIDFGFAFNDYISLRQGTREGARQAAVIATSNAVPAGGGAWVQGTNCTTNPTSGLASPAFDLICYTKQRIGLDETNTRVSIWWDSTKGYTASPSDPNSAYSVVVCTQRKLTSVSGLFSPVLNNKVINAKTEIRIEQTSSTMTALTPPVQENPLSSWPSSCAQS
jgi:Flp pilus assembly protein TadG